MNVTFWAPEGNIVQMECPLGIQFYFSFLMSKIANHTIVRLTSMLDESDLTTSTLIGDIIRPSEEAPIEVSAITSRAAKPTNWAIFNTIVTGIQTPKQIPCILPVDPE